MTCFISRIFEVFLQTLYMWAFIYLYMHDYMTKVMNSFFEKGLSLPPHTPPHLLQKSWVLYLWCENKSWFSFWWGLLSIADDCAVCWDALRSCSLPHQILWSKLCKLLEWLQWMEWVVEFKFKSGGFEFLILFHKIKIIRIYVKNCIEIV